MANRGEIAIRIFRTLRELGIRSVAVYSDADRDALHVQYADEAVCIGGKLPGESYLVIQHVLDAAQSTGAEAVHPGYGFLAENAEFARACERAGVIFIGPPADAIERMGSKTASRELMQAAGVPIVPGTTEAVATLKAARAAADEIGYPVAVKARSGGGGKGFRVALDADALESAFEGAAREGERYFSDAAVYLERYLPDPRHVEVQILADQHGTTIHLGERDCSIQRRHQKLVEESPAPAIDAALRERLATIALGAARAVDYTSAGTIECLLDAEGNAWFLEMNTRVQVEHTVTELVTGIDIVAEQVRIAAGQPLRITQEDVELRGHAIECRINAEDARADFRPSSGTIRRWSEPSGAGVRVDAGYEAGSVVSPYYDTLLAKLIVHAHDRPAALGRMARALEEFDVDGVDTLIDFHRAVISSEEFAAGGTCRSLVESPGAALDALGPSHLRPRPARVHSVAAPERMLLELDGQRVEAVVHDPRRALPAPPIVRARGTAAGGLSADGSLVAPIPGNVLQVLVKAGQPVQAGEVVCILEAMKMENEIAAAADAVVDQVHVTPGEAVAAGQALVSFAT